MPPLTSEVPILWWHAIVLGLAQGLTEFIPVSSSAHLNILHWVLGQPRHVTFTYDALLNIGTLSALAYYFRGDWKALLTDRSQRRLRNMVFLGCVPAVIVGVLLRGLEDSSPLFVDVRFNAVILFVMGALLWVADIASRRRRTLESISVKDAIIIGCSQALALIPGVSRSGATITFGLLRRFDRTAATRFSFLMSLPITAGAVCFEVFSVWRHGDFSHINASPLSVLVGIVVSGVVGFWAIGFLLNYIKTRSMLLFFIWRAVVALAVFAIYPFIAK